MTSTRGVVALIIVAQFAVALLTGCTAAQTDAVVPTPSPDPALVAAPSGDGDCTTVDPCSLPTALSRVEEGGSIELGSGSYGRQRLVSGTRLARFSTPIVVRAAPGAKAVFDLLYSGLPNVTWQGFTVNGVVYLTHAASGTTLRGLHIDGGGVFVRSDRTTLSGNLIENGSSLDGVQIGGAQGITLERNTIRNFNQSGTSGYHADCVQLFDTANVRLIRNSLTNCYNAEIIFSGGAGKGIKNVVIESNFVSGCRVKGPSCAGGTVIDLREKSVEGVVVRNNTFLNGSARIEPLPGMVLDRNVFSYLSYCTSPITNSIVAKWNVGLCGTYPTIGSDGNRLGTVAVKSIDANDLTPTTPADVRIDPTGTAPKVRGFDGTMLPPDVAGAKA